jgi:hypothetical protein
VIAIGPIISPFHIVQERKRRDEVAIDQLGMSGHPTNGISQIQSNFQPHTSNGAFRGCASGPEDLSIRRRSQLGEYLDGS